MFILKQATAGIAVPEVCRKHGVSSATFYKWRSKYGGNGSYHDNEAKGTGTGEQ